VGGDINQPQNPLSKFHTASWGLRVDYVLPSAHGFDLIDNGIFWPTKSEETYRLIKNREASSDHKLVWSELMIK
jgi:hypothetical protein